MADHDRILVSVDGGLGDHVLAEPSVRYLIQKVYPRGDVRIVCTVPRVFSHLGVPVSQHTGFDIPGYKKLLTFPRTGPLPEALCFLTAHMVDFHSASLLCRHLPLLDKTIQLQVLSEDLAELGAVLGDVNPEKLVLVHAGKSWRSKTFPRGWWQSVADSLLVKGISVCLVGKRSPDDPRDQTGLVEVDALPGVYDLRDKLSLGALFALLQKASVLLSNDTSLIQMAGAFDNWIVLIPSCKHPDFVLPYRQGTPYYKARALCKRLFIDDIPFEPIRDQHLTVDAEPENWLHYLPEPEAVAREICGILKT